MEGNGGAFPNARPVTVVAALENNHNGSLSLAKRLADVAAECGANAVKLPVRSVRDSIAPEALEQPDYRYPEFGTTYGAVLDRLELGAAEVKELREYCRGKISFIGAPQDLPSMELLESLAVEVFQVDPAVLSHRPLLERINAAKRDVLVCAGMCSEEDLKFALGVLKDSRVRLLHCVVSDALELEETRLSYVPYLRRQFGRDTGYLGLEPGIHAAVAAFTAGASIIEKRFTIDRHLPGPFHARSLDRDEFALLVRTLRALERSLAPCGERAILPIELDAFTSQRGSLVAARPLKAGTTLEPGMIAVKAPLRGIGPELLSWVEGKRLLYDLPADAAITFGMVEP